MVQRHTTRRPRVAARRLIVAACVLAAGAVAPVPAIAQAPNPGPLWNAYPLDEGAQSQTTPATPKATTPAPTPQRTSAPTPVSAKDEAGGGPPWLLIVLAGVGGALFMALVLVVQGRRDSRTAESPPAAVGPEKWPWLTAGSTNGKSNGVATHAPPAPPPEPEPALEPEPEPAFEVDEAVSVPVRRFEREEAPAPSPQQRAAAARRGPICQVRWHDEASRFYAVTIDAEGVEHELARSLPFDSRDPGPPSSDDRRAQSALRLLAKELREQGWRPMRVKGTDHDAPRWYARRFRFPVAEGEDETVAWSEPQRQPSSSQSTFT
jgi:hypothetical protein